MNQMEKKELLDQVLEQKIAIIDCDTQEVTDIVTVDGICEGFEMQIQEREDGMICLYVFPDSGEWEDELGDTLYSVLVTLSNYREYFNCLDDENEAWESDFLAYYKK